MRILLIALFLLSNAHGKSPSPWRKRGFKAEDIGYILIDIESGEINKAHNPQKMFSLGSVSKIFSLYYALKQLGADFTFKTQLVSKGKIQKGVLKGDLILKGGGDPYLTTSHLVSLIQQLKIRGIRSIEGNFFFDDSLLPSTDRLSPLGLEDQPDNPSISALSVEFNRFKVFKNNQAIPPLDMLAITPVKDKVSGSKYSYAKGKWRSHPAQHKWPEELPIRRGSLFTAEFFRYLASIQRLKLSPPQRKEAIGFSVLASNRSLPLIRLVSLAFEYSNNLFAELPTLMAAHLKNNKIKSIEQANSLAVSWLSSNIKELTPQNLKLKNASGLHLENQATPTSTAQFIKSLFKKEMDGRSLLSLFTINGASGSLLKRLNNKELVYRVYAKTGSLHYISNLAGYLIGKSGKIYAFALFTQEGKKRKELSEGSPKRKNILRAQAKYWQSKAKRLHDELLKIWIKNY